MTDNIKYTDEEQEFLDNNEHILGAAEAWLDNGMGPDQGAFDDAYCGEWDSFLEYAEHYALENVFPYQASKSYTDEPLIKYFDYESFANDLQYDYWTGDADRSGVYVFRNF